MTRRYIVTYDVDRGSMMGDTVAVIVWADGILDAVRQARQETFRATDCIERLSLLGVKDITDKAVRGIEFSSSVLFGTRMTR